MRWKRTLLLVPVFVSLLLVTVVEKSNPATGKARREGIIAALRDPLSLFAERSPGGRGAGMLLSVKSNIRPRERVLSTVREREPSLGVPAEADNPVFGAAPEGLATNPAAIPGDDLPEDQVVFYPITGSPFPLPPSPTIIPGPGTTAVPEPGIWAMLIVGFFAVGVAMRRHGRKQASPAVSNNRY